MTLKELKNDNLLVKVIREEKTVSGVYYGAVAGHIDVIRDAKEQIQDGVLRAEVLMCGPGRVTKKGIVLPMDVQTGDTVRFDCKIGITVPGKSEDYLMLSERAVLAVEC